MALESIKIKNVEKYLVDMEEWNPSKYGKRVLCIIMIFKTLTPWLLLNDLWTLEAVRHDMDSCNRDYEAMARSLQHVLAMCLQWGWHHTTPNIWTGLRFNSDGYMKLLQTVGKSRLPRIVAAAAGGSYVWQQDSVSCRKESELVVGEYLQLHQPQFLTS